MQDALRRLRRRRATWTDPQGGFFLWVTFADPRVDTQALFETALAEGVAYIPGPAFSVNDRTFSTTRCDSALRRRHPGSASTRA